ARLRELLAAARPLGRVDPIDEAGRPPVGRRLKPTFGLARSLDQGLVLARDQALRSGMADPVRHKVAFKKQLRLGFADRGRQLLRRRARLDQPRWWRRELVRARALARGRQHALTGFLDRLHRPSLLTPLPAGDARIE